MPEDPIVKFDPNQAVNAIREKIRGAMLDIIPDEQWNEMIRSEMDAFMKDKVVRRTGWDADQVTPAGFKVVVRQLLEEQARERVKALLSSPEWTGAWSTNVDQEASQAVQKFIQKHAGEILSAWVGKAVQQVILQMQVIR